MRFAWVVFASVVIVACAVGFLTRDFPTSSSSDEVLFHYPTVMTFRAQFPAVDLHDYKSATGPTYHLFQMMASFVVGASMVALRVVNALITLAIFPVCFLLLRRMKMSVEDSALCSGVLLLSPYVLGAMFFVVTDNFALLAGLCSLLTFFVYVQDGSKSALVGLVLFTAIAITARQTYAWLLLFQVVGLFVFRVERARRLPIILGAVVAALPLCWLIYLWGGLVPPSSAVHSQTDGLKFHSLQLLFVLCALFFVPLFPFVAKAKEGFVKTFGVAVIASALMFFITPFSHDTVGAGDGIVMSISEKFPNLFSTSLLYWLIVPIGIFAFFAVFSVRSDDGARLGLCVLLGTFLFLLPSSILYERYMGPSGVLAAVLLGGGAGQRVNRFGLALVVLGCVAVPFVRYRMATSAFGEPSVEYHLRQHA